MKWLSPQFRAVALPREHGGWAMVLEAGIVVIGVYPGLNALCLLLSALTAFFLLTPLKIVLRDRLAKRVYPRTRAAFRAASVYLVISLSLLFWVWQRNRGLFWVPVAMASVLFTAQIYFALRREEKSLAAEVLGAMTPGALAAAVFLCEGTTLFSALLIWSLLALRGVTSVFYVRARLSLARGQQRRLWPVGAVHGAGALVLGRLYFMDELPVLATLAYALLCGRAVYGLVASRRDIRPQAVGVQEVVIGVIHSLLLAAAFM